MDKIISIITNLSLISVIGYNAYLYYKDSLNRNVQINDKMCYNQPNYATTRMDNSHNIQRYADGSHTYFKLSKDALDELTKHGPLLEACAGGGKNSKLLRERGVDIISYDLYAHENNDIIEGMNGTFEHNYPDRTLCIFCGQNSIASILNYKGKKLIIGGYLKPDLQNNIFMDLESNTELTNLYEVDMRPDNTWLEKNGWKAIKTLIWKCPLQYENIDNTQQYEQYQKSTLSFMMRIYVR